MDKVFQHGPLGVSKQLNVSEWCTGVPKTIDNRTGFLLLTPPSSEFLNPPLTKVRLFVKEKRLHLICLD